MSEERLPAKIEDAVERVTERAVEAYEDNTALRVVVSSIPLVGGRLDLIFASEGQRVSKARVFKLLDDLRENMEQLSEDAIDKDYLESEVFIDLVMKAVDSATKTRDEQKIRLYARILANSTVKRKQGNYFPEEYLHLSADLTPLDLRVARRFYESGDFVGDEKAWEAWLEQTYALLEVDRAVLPMILSRIASTGLIEPVTAGLDGSGFWIHQGEYGDPSFYRVAPAFQKLMKFLEWDESFLRENVA